VWANHARGLALERVIALDVSWTLHRYIESRIFWLIDLWLSYWRIKNEKSPPRSSSWSSVLILVCVAFSTEWRNLYWILRSTRNYASTKDPIKHFTLLDRWCVIVCEASISNQRNFFVPTTTNNLFGEDNAFDPSN
jgi:hypothetical protein